MAGKSTSGSRNKRQIQVEGFLHFRELYGRGVRVYKGASFAAQGVTHPEPITACDPGELTSVIPSFIYLMLSMYGKRRSKTKFPLKPRKKMTMPGMILKRVPLELQGGKRVR